jgi:hemerythrin-like domain-containing protein
MSTDAIVMLKDDHKEIRHLFAEFQNAGDGAVVTRGKIVDRILEALTVHTYLENEVMYPETRKLVPDIDADLLEAYEEHHVADVLCLELSAMEPDDEHFVAKATVLIESVSHHMDEEENDMFPAVRERLGRKALQEIGARMAEIRPNAPRYPAQPGALKKALDAILA